MGITEPATLVTDYLLAVFTAVLSWRLARGGVPQRWWAAGLAASSVAGAAGGTVHGFQPLLPPPVTATLWLLTLEALVFAGLAIVRATLASAPLPAAARRASAIAATAGYASYAAWVPARPLFASAIAAYGAALLILGGVETRRWWRERAAASSWLLGGVLLSAAAALVQQAGWAPHRHFNHNDLFHVIQAGAVWLLYRGASLSRAASPAR